MKTASATKRITPRAAASILQAEGISCNADTITRWCRTGMLKRSIQVGRQWYIDEDEVRGLTARA